MELITLAPVESREPACFPKLQSPVLVALTFLGMYSHGGLSSWQPPFSAPCSNLG